ncbi:MAG: class IV adenylate cyclase [Ruminococcus sp.]|nr:class IV adenylate cyclase [Ruminococcus sp.]
MYEVEIKAYLDNKEEIIQKLILLGCIWDKKIKQYDIIYRLNDTLDSNEIYMRIRHENSTRPILTFKKILNSFEVIEYETVIDNSDELKKMLQLIGFKEYAIINKSRQVGIIGEITICLDDVEGLGAFIEVEKKVENSHERECTLSDLKNFIFSLGINSKQLCNKRYHTMINEQKGGLSLCKLSEND